MDLRDHQERKESRASQEDLEVPVRPVAKGNRAWRCLRRAIREIGDLQARLDSPAYEVTRVSPDRTVFPVHRELRGSLDSPASDSRDPLESKGSQVSQASQDLLPHQADQE